MYKKPLVIGFWATVSLATNKLCQSSKKFCHSCPREADSQRHRMLG